jgi:hypothetical protein
VNTQFVDFAIKIFALLLGAGLSVLMWKALRDSLLMATGLPLNLEFISFRSIAGITGSICQYLKSVHQYLKNEDNDKNQKEYHPTLLEAVVSTMLLVAFSMLLLLIGVSCGFVIHFVTEKNPVALDILIEMTISLVCHSRRRKMGEKP